MLTRHVTTKTACVRYLQGDMMGGAAMLNMITRERTDDTSIHRVLSLVICCDGSPPCQSCVARCVVEWG